MQEHIGKKLPEEKLVHNLDGNQAKNPAADQFQSLQQVNRNIGQQQVFDGRRNTAKTGLIHVRRFLFEGVFLVLRIPAKEVFQF